MKTNRVTYIYPGFEIGTSAARFLTANIIQATDLALALSVSLPQLSRLNANGIVFRQSQGKYYFAESIANYIACKSAPRAYTYEEALKAATAAGMIDPVASARSWSGWKIEPSEDIETVRSRHRPFTTPDLIYDFQCELRKLRKDRLVGKDIPAHYDAASDETFLLMRRIGINDSPHKSGGVHSKAYEKAWTPEMDKARPKSFADRLKMAETAAQVVADEQMNVSRRYRWY